MKLGVEIIILKITIGMTVFNFSCKTSKVKNRFLLVLGKKYFLRDFLKVPTLARSVPKPLKVPSLARSVPKPLKVPSLARSVPKPLKVPSLARSVPKPLLL